MVEEPLDIQLQEPGPSGVAGGVGHRPAAEAVGGGPGGGDAVVQQPVEDAPLDLLEPGVRHPEPPDAPAGLGALHRAVVPGQVAAHGIKSPQGDPQISREGGGLPVHDPFHGQKASSLGPDAHLMYAGPGERYLARSAGTSGACRDTAPRPRLSGAYGVGISLPAATRRRGRQGTCQTGAGRPGRSHDSTALRGAQEALAPPAGEML